MINFPVKQFGVNDLSKSIRSKNTTLSYFTISKSYFINYTISFYNTTYIPKLYYFTFLLKYYFLIFLYYFFPIITFFKDSNGKIFLGFWTLFFFQTCILQQSHFSWAMQHYFFSNSDVDSSGLSLAFIISFQQWCFFKWRHRDTENEKREGNWSIRQWREKFQGKKKMK